MTFNIELQTKPESISERAKEVMADFDMTFEHAKEHFEGNIDIDGKEWSIGAIVGGSGTGKSTIAKTLFGENGYVKGFEYNGASVLDDMPSEATTKDIEMAFSSVGFSSPPSWLKPYSVLSTGEKMRVDLARATLIQGNIVVFDEFTSVVDRTVAKTASYAIQKAFRKRGRQFVAVSCHKDILEWLQPDWVYDTDQKGFFGYGGNIISPLCSLMCTELTTGIKHGCGTYLGSITI